MNRRLVKKHTMPALSMFAERLPVALRDRAPKLVDDAGNDWLVCEGRKLMAAAHMAGLTRNDVAVPDDSALRPSRWDISPASLSSPPPTPKRPQGLGPKLASPRHCAHALRRLCALRVRATNGL